MMLRKLSFFDPFIPQSLSVRRALSATIALLFAYFADSEFSTIHQSWIPLLTVILLLFRAKFSLRDLSVGFALSILGLLVAFFIGKSSIAISETNLLLFLAIIILYFIEILFKRTLVIFIIPGVLYLFWHRFWPDVSLYELLHDALIAAGIVLVTTIFIFPARADVDFRCGIIPLFHAYQAYLQSIVDFLFDKKAYDLIAFEQKHKVIKALLDEESVFPEWVYQFGFSLFFQRGHRHFLIRTEQIGAVLFAMHQTARYDIDKNLLIDFKPSILAVVAAIETLFQTIIARLQLQTVELPMSILEKETAELDAALMKITPASLELIDISEDYLRLASLVYELKDLEKLLKRLAESLR